MAYDPSGISWWTTQRVEELKARWANRESGSEICRAIGATSRNAVIGKAYRLGLGPHRQNNRPRYSVKAKPTLHYGNKVERAKPKESRGEMIMAAEEHTFTNPKRLIELREYDCRWPDAGEPRVDMLFCAAPVVKGQSYCSCHCQIAYPGVGSK